MSKKEERKRVLPWLACVGRETKLESFDFTNRLKNRCYKPRNFLFFIFEKRKSKKRKETLELAKKIVIVIVEKKTTLTLELVVYMFQNKSLYGTESGTTRGIAIEIFESVIHYGFK